MTLHTEAASVLPVVLRGVRLRVLMPGMDEGERSSVCGSLVCVSDWLTAVMSHRGVTYGCNLALITYTITLTLIRLSLRWAVTDTVGGQKKNACSGFSDGWTCWSWEEFTVKQNKTLADLHKAIMQRLKPNVPRKTSWFHAARRRSQVIGPVSGNESPPALRPWPRGRPFMDNHFITKQSAERLQTKDTQPPGVTLPRQPWREVGGWNKQRIIPEIETSKRQRSVGPRANSLTSHFVFLLDESAVNDNFGVQVLWLIQGNFLFLAV